MKYEILKVLCILESKSLNEEPGVELEQAKICQDCSGINYFFILLDIRDP